MKHFFALIFLTLSVSLVFGQKTQPACADSAEMVYVNQIYLSGNKITHDKIIYRELAFQAGDSLCLKAFLEALKKSKENLNNSSLFNFVEVRDVQVVSDGKIHANVHIDLVERWYIWPIPIVEIAERNPNSWWETKDFSKINYGLFFTWGNFRGRREALRLLFRGGYDELLGFHYDIPFINKLQTLGVVLGAGLRRNHEVTYQTIENKPARYRDDSYIRHEYYAYMALNIRKNIHASHYFSIEYNNHQYGDVVFELNPDFDPNQKREYTYFSLTYFYKNDHRDNRPYPLNGYYVDAILIKRGLGISSNANVNLLSLTSNLRKYWNLGHQWYFASGFTGRIANTGRNPYFLNTGLGYKNDFVRGYEYYVVDGQNFALIKTDLKYALFQDRITNLPILPSKFSKIHWSVYLSFFADAAYSTTELPQLSNTLQNEVLFGYGAGLNFVSYYDIVFRLEYSFNKLNERGFFISIMASI